MSNDKYHLCPIDYQKLGYRHQSNLHKYQHPERCDALYQIACGKPEDSYKEEFTTLIEKGYAKREGDKILSNIPVMSAEKNRDLEDLYIKSAEDLGINLSFKKLNNAIENVIKSNFTNLIQGSSQKYRYLITNFEFASFFCESLYKKKYITIPEENDNTPMTSYIILK